MHRAELDDNSSKQRMGFIDGLRAIAALLVILPHSIGLFSTVPSAAFMLPMGDFGHRGVEIFFVLSGFVIAYTLRSATVTPMYALAFLARRSIRLDPPYWAAILLMLGCLWMQKHLGHGDMPSSARVVSHVFYMQELLGFGSVNVVFWTLCIEIQFYLAFILLIALAQRTTPQWILVTAFAGSLFWPLGIINAWPAIFLTYWYAFLIGAIVCWSLNGKMKTRTMIVSLAVLWIIAVWRFDSRYVVAATTASLLAVAGTRDGLHRWLSNRPTQFVGRISYSLYLVHLPIIAFILGARTRAFSINSFFVAACLAIVTFAASVFAAWLFFRLIESPSLRLSKRIRLGGQPIKQPPATLPPATQTLASATTASAVAPTT